MSLKHLVIGGKNISYGDIGEGPETVILIHCSGASHRIFHRLNDALAEHYRVIAPDLAGYGASESWPANESFSYTFDVKIIKRLIEGIGSPVHLVGYSYGGLIALETALITPQIRSLTLLEPIALHLLKDSDNIRLQKEVQTMGASVVKYAKNGDPHQAAKAYINYWGGPWGWFLMPREIKNVVQHSVAKTAMEFSSAIANVNGLAAYRTISCPVLLIGGSASRNAAKAVIEMLEAALVRTKTVWLKGASHLNLLKQKSVNEIIFNWLETDHNNLNGSDR